MDSTYLRHVAASQANEILESLTHQQYLHPHQPLRGAIQSAAGAIGFCSGAGEQAMKWLGLDGGRSIGRLRRTELTQLAHSVDRFWRQAVESASPLR